MTFFRFVDYASVPGYLAKGWIIDDDMQSTPGDDSSSGHHGRHAVLMMWSGPGEPE